MSATDPDWEFDHIDPSLAPHMNEVFAGIRLVISSADRDPAVFDQPDDFVCPRDENPHVAFGYGIHGCVGEHLAKLEMRVVAEEVLRLMPDHRLADGFQPTWLLGGMMRGLTTLPAVTGDAQLR